MGERWGGTVKELLRIGRHKTRHRRRAKHLKDQLRPLIPLEADKNAFTAPEWAEPVHGSASCGAPPSSNVTLALTYAYSDQETGAASR